MRLVVSYLLLCLFCLSGLLVLHHMVVLPSFYVQYILYIRCALLGSIGGVTYCLRAVYLNRCVNNRWDNNWHIWYYLRPIVSGIMGFVSCVVIKGGLLLLEASSDSNSIAFGYLALAFIAGYNVDHFLLKLETLSETIWGIKKSRASKPNQVNDEGERDA